MVIVSASAIYRAGTSRIINSLASCHGLSGAGEQAWTGLVELGRRRWWLARARNNSKGQRGQQVPVRA